LIANRGVPFRGNLAGVLQRVDVPGLIKLVDWGPVDWPRAGEREVAFVYERPEGGPAGQVFARRDGRTSDLELTRRLLRLIVAGLHALSEAGMAYRAIRPDNVWLATSGDGVALLGDAVAGPPGFDQPAAFEPIERAMATPAGRGLGTVADDVYALGVTLLSLITGRDFSGPGGEDELLQAKMERGSYAALTAGLRVPLPLSEPLRGMLGDDLAERWSLRDLQAWLGGRPPSTRVSHGRRLPDLPVVVGGRAWSSPRALALALTRNVPEAAIMIRSGALETWVRNSLHDPPRAKYLAMLAAASEEKAGADDALVAKVALTLDPAAPVRHRGFSFAVDGFGPALAELVLRGASVQPAAEALIMRLAEGGYRPLANADAAQSAAKSSLIGAAAPAPGGAAAASAPSSGPKFGALASWVRNIEPGFGIERVLYETNRTLPCLSPLLKRQCVIKLRSLLPALEAAANAKASGRPVDRHIAAFVAARSREPLGESLTMLAATDVPTQVLGGLGLLVKVLEAWPVPELPALTKWVGRTLQPVIAEYHNRELRETIEKEVQRAVAAGDLRLLYAALGDPERRRRDKEGFEAAKTRYERASVEIQRLQRGEAQRRRLAETTGLQAASIIACLTATGSICLSLIFAIR
jgi:serine/threonine protein kinase